MEETLAASAPPRQADHKAESKSLWGHAWDTLVRDRVAVFSMIVVALYAVTAVLCASGLLAANWSEELGPSYAAPSGDHWFGLDIFGRSVGLKALKGVQVAMTVGFSAALLATFVGVVIGAIGGYFGGVVDEIVVWLYTTVTSIPYILLLMGIALALGKGIHSVIIALGLTGWVGICRLVRGEVIRHKEREYVHAASAVGGGNARKLFKHILPNVFHLVIIQFSLRFQMAIKAEVILSFLGIGVQGTPSWGLMIDEAKLELMREPSIWWGLATATAAMFGIVLAFNLLGDALRDALDPKLKGK